MPAKSQQQLKLIYAKRDQYGNKSKTPEKWKWVWDEEWTDVKFSKLPEKVEEDYFDRDSIIDYILSFANFEKSDLEKKSEKELIDLFDKVGRFMQLHPGQKLQLQESLSDEDREEYINTIKANSMFEKDFLEAKSDKELMELYDEVVDFLEVHPIDPRGHLEEFENKVFITKFDEFINESHDHRGPLPVANKIKGKWEIESFDGLAEEASDYEPFEILDVKRDPGYGYEHVVMFFVKFTKGVPKKYQTPENTYGLGIWDMDNKEFIEELGTLEDYGITIDSLEKKTGFRIPK